MNRLNTSETANVTNVVNTSTLVKPAHNLKYKTKLDTSHGCTFWKHHVQERERQLILSKTNYGQSEKLHLSQGAHTNFGKARAVNT
ncbi:hypothetical protein CEXT_352101 [Caerostris extrusa]|uniref:Uncharacterized protein n=1 Tax=Caerostris extrusa TaxID=172846 RepID=A0AAV4WJS3_CAEEX|nr:hypothetical protein CEXT_352101 [Caerostris extrusa]